MACFEHSSQSTYEAFVAWRAFCPFTWISLSKLLPGDVL